jgi:prolyl-tRNA editing enzyme YbaK/EbsC (Cys-tRNA(Pro) deacylase)
LLLLDSGTSTQGSPVKPRGERGAQAIGDVAPVGHPEPLRTIVDIALAKYDVVWAAGGHPHYVFPTTYDELLRITAGEAAEVGA